MPLYLFEIVNRKRPKQYRIKGGLNASRQNAMMNIYVQAEIRGGTLAHLLATYSADLATFKQSLNRNIQWCGCTQELSRTHYVVNDADASLRWPCPFIGNAVRA